MSEQRRGLIISEKRALLNPKLRKLGLSVCLTLVDRDHFLVLQNGAAVLAYLRDSVANDQRALQTQE